MIEGPELVGTPRFELGTSRTPSVRATRLRHVPSLCFKYVLKRPIVKSSRGQLRQIYFFDAADLDCFSSRSRISRSSAANFLKAPRSAVVLPPVDAGNSLTPLARCWLARWTAFCSFEEKSADRE